MLCYSSKNTQSFQAAFFFSTTQFWNRPIPLCSMLCLSTVRNRLPLGIPNARLSRGVWSAQETCARRPEPLRRSRCHRQPVPEAAAPRRGGCSAKQRQQRSTRQYHGRHKDLSEHTYISLYLFFSPVISRTKIQALWCSLLGAWGFLSSWCVRHHL